MNYRPYDVYKDSGIEWIGDIPDGWEVKRLKYVGKAIIGLTYSPDQIVIDSQQGTLVFRSSNVQNGKISYSDTVYVDTEIPEKLHVRNGDILICSRNGSKALIGKNALITATDTGNTFGAFMTIFRSRYYKFLYYVFNSNIFEFQADSCMTTTVNQLTTGNLNSMEIPLPPLSEQTAIADFLDTETAKIATIIATKQRLIEKLQEKRSSIVSRAVTKGLDPNAKMKPSGIEWIGDIPEGWEVKKLKYVVETKITDGPHTTPQILSDGIPFVSAEAAKESRIDLKQIRGYISEDDHKEFCKKCKPQKEDIFMVKSGATTGAISFVDIDDEFSIWSPLALVRSKKNKYKQRYIFYSMLSDLYKKQVEISWSYGTQQNIGMGVIENLVIFAPRLPEQTAIADYLDTETAKIDDIIAKTKNSIDKLNEYKTALISACVTGKIDVRGAN